MASSYKKIYHLLDPIIGGNPKILYSELEKSHPELAKQITYWSFNARKNAMFPKKGKKSKVKKVGKNSTK